MIVVNFFSSDKEWWIEYRENGNLNKIIFEDCSEYKNFIETNNLNIIVNFC
jgi:hypothetical protein